MIADRALVVVSVGLVLVASTAAGVLGWQLSSTREDLAVCTSNNVMLKAQVEEQNDSIASWKETADKAVDGGKVALAAAQALTKAKAGQINALQGLVKNGKDTDCASALRTIREGLAK